MINEPGKPILTPGTTDGLHSLTLFSVLATLLAAAGAALLRRLGLVALLRRLGVVAVPVGARSARLHRFGETRALSVPAERHGRTARYGRASGTASGAIGRRLPGQPVAVAQSSWLRRVQQFERASDCVRFARRLGTAWRRPLSAGLHAAPSPQAASFGRGGGCVQAGSPTLSLPP